jgi:mono/diheme cytochrome c family protein
MNLLRQLICLSLSAVAVPSVAMAENVSDPSGVFVFLQSRCFVCHGELGYGGAGPGFRGDKMLASDQYVVSRILLGGGIMPSFAATLSDQEIAAVATYVRNSWGNDFGPVMPDHVAPLRASLKANANPPQSPGEAR